MNDPAPVPETYPPLGIFEVRRELEPHTDIRGFDISIDVELTRAASLDQFQRRLRLWLRAALVAKKPEGLSGLDIHGRGRYLDQLEAEWEAQRAARPKRPPFAALSDPAEPGC
jgi:hypothetical protein